MTTTEPAELAEALASAELKPGDEGLAVARLQHALITLSYLSEDQIQSGPGVFGPKTTNALKTLQSEWAVESSGQLCPGTREVLVKALRGLPPPGGWSGKRPAPGTTDVRHWIATTPPLRGGRLQPSGERYAAVIDQFAVEANPRYMPRDGNVFAHIFLWDVSSAMGAEIPHWIDERGEAASPGKGREGIAADVPLWLEHYGRARGWRRVSAEDAQALANEGQLVIGTNLVTDGTRLAVVRPGEAHPNGPWVALGGARPQMRVLAQDALADGADFWAHDGARSSAAITDEETGEAARRIKRGDSGQDVLWAQEALVALGHLTRAEMATGPGAFGPRTETAVKAFQLKAGLPPTGVVGNLTRSAIQAWVARAGEPNTHVPPVTLDRGCAGREVWALQNALLRIALLDWDSFVISPGTYGPKTEAAVRSLQVRFGLPATGVFGPRTQQALAAALADGLPELGGIPNVLGAERAIAFVMNPPPNEGPNAGSWSNAPMALVREAYRSSMRIKGPFSEDTPADAVKAFKSAKRLQQEGTPPRGALVFFGWGQGGYVGISLGDGRFVGSPTHGPCGEARPIWTRTYQGWAIP